MPDVEFKHHVETLDSKHTRRKSEWLLCGYFASDRRRPEIALRIFPRKPSFAKTMLDQI